MYSTLLRNIMFQALNQEEACNWLPHSSFQMLGSLGGWFTKSSLLVPFLQLDLEIWYLWRILNPFLCTSNIKSSSLTVNILCNKFMISNGQQKEWRNFYNSIRWKFVEGQPRAKAQIHFSSDWLCKIALLFLNCMLFLSTILKTKVKDASVFPWATVKYTIFTQQKAKSVHI